MKSTMVDWTWGRGPMFMPFEQRRTWDHLMKTIKPPKNKLANFGYRGGQWENPRELRRND